MSAGQAEGWRDAVARLKPHFHAATRVVVRGIQMVASAPDTPAVSVIVPACNQAAWLAQALSSLQHQKLDAWECVVVDDASTDHAFDVARLFAEADPRFRIVAHRDRRGAAAAANTGVHAARADLVVVLEAKDLLFPDTLAAHVDATAQSLRGGTYCGSRPFRSVGVPKLPSSPARRPSAMGVAPETPAAPSVCSATAMPRNTVLDLGGFNENITHAWAEDLWARMLRRGHRFTYLPTVGVANRRLPGPAEEHLVYATQIAALARDAQKGPGAVGRFLTERLLQTLASALADGHNDAADGIAALVRPHLDGRGSAWLDRAVAHAVRATGVRRPALSAALAEDVRAHLDRPGDLSVDDPTSTVSQQPHTKDRPATEEIRLVPRALRIMHAGERPPPHDAVLLVPQARYHVEELGPLALELDRRGVPTAFMTTAVEGRIGEALRKQVHTELLKYTDTLWEWDPHLPTTSRLLAVVVMNDWGPSRELVEMAKQVGVTTFAKSEGVQDFRDRDTGRERRPYRLVDVVLGQGPNDVAALPGADVRVVGSTRLETAWRGEDSTREPVVAVNLNFTYNVLTEHANDWLTSVVRACENAGLDYVVCPHPAQYKEHVDPALCEGRLATEPIRHLLLRAGVLVTRFSTVVYEAMARGVPSIYHNPHGEKVWDDDPRGRPPTVTRTTATLVNALRSALDVEKPFSRDGLFDQISVDPDSTPDQRAADAVVASPPS